MDAASTSELPARTERLLDLAAQGMVDKAIAAELGLSVHTIDAQWRGLRDRFGAANRTEVVARYLELRHARKVEALCAKIQILEEKANAHTSPDEGEIVRRFELSARAALPDLTDLERLRPLEEAVRRGDTIFYEGEIGGLWRKHWVFGDCERFGFTGADFVSGETRIADLVPPEDLLANFERFGRTLDEGGDGFVSYYRLRLPDGTFRWLRDRMTFLRDEHGVATRYLGSATDVTDLAERLDPATLRDSPPTS